MRWPLDRNRAGASACRGRRRAGNASDRPVPCSSRSADIKRDGHDAHRGSGSGRRRDSWKTPPVVLVSQPLARALYLDQDPVGQPVQLLGPQPAHDRRDRRGRAAKQSGRDGFPQIFTCRINAARTRPGSRDPTGDATVGVSREVSARICGARPDAHRHRRATAQESGRPIRVAAGARLAAAVVRAFRCSRSSSRARHLRCVGHGGRSASRNRRLDGAWRHFAGMCAAHLAERFA